MLNRSTANRVPIEITDTLSRRIAARLSPPTDTGCLLWLGCATPLGYGRISISIDGRERFIYPHRYVATATYGPIPDEMVVDHLCRNPSCCEPSHLEIVTVRVNTVERAIGRLDTLTHCRNGHSYTPENTDRRRGGKGRDRDRWYRACLTCRRNRDRANTS